jgi:hypothetical protein
LFRRSRSDTNKAESEMVLLFFAQSTDCKL